MRCDLCQREDAIEGRMLCAICGEALQRLAYADLAIRQRVLSTQWDSAKVAVSNSSSAQQDNTSDYLSSRKKFASGAMLAVALFFGITAAFLHSGKSASAKWKVPSPYLGAMAGLSN